MSSAVTSPNWRETPIANLIAGIRGGSPALWRATLGMALGMVICIALVQIDTRTFNGINVWDKPAKFFLSLAVQFATVSFALSLLPAVQRELRGIRIAIWAMIVAGFFEIGYIALRAARGEASHFNDSSALAQILYGAMGLGALTLTLTAFYIGYRVWQQRGRGLIVEIAGLGLMLGMALGTAAGAYLSAQHGHWVGGEMNDTHGLGLIGWSTTGGDLRVAHFFGLHTAQGLPLAALSGSRLVVYLVAFAFIAATGITFVQAVWGVPLFKI
jgi:hypothetical protein